MLAVLLIGASLSNWRSALVGVLALPVTLGVAVLGLRAVGGTINTMVLAGLIVALAVVIDAAVVDAQQLRERLRQRQPGEGLLATIGAATLQAQRTALYAVLMMALATAPIYFLGGVSSAFFEPLGVAYLLVIGASLLVALTVTPALSLLLMSAREAPVAAPSATPSAAPRAMPGLMTRHAGWLRGLAGRPPWALGAAVGLVLVAAVVWPMLGQSLLPQLKEHQLLVNWTTPPGTSHAETYRITQRVTKELEAIPGVRSVGGHLGRAVTGDQVVGINASRLWVSLASDADREATLAAIRETVDGYPGVAHSLQYYLRDKVGEVLTGQNKPIVVRIFGPQREVLKQKAEEVRAAVASIPGVVDLSAEGQVEEPHVQVKVYLEAAGKANVKPGDVRRSAASVFSGMVVGYLFKDQRIFEVVVWGAPETRQNLSNLQDLWVEKSDRSHTRLGDIAEVAVRSTPTMMRHEGRAPYVDVLMGVDGRDPSAVASDVAQRVAGVKFPLEYHPEVLGEYAKRAGTQQRMIVTGIAVLVGMLLLLQACLRNWTLAAVGLTLGSTVGLLAVLGLAARHNLTLISALQAGDQGLPQAARLDRMLRVTQQQLPAICISVAATVLAMLPIIAGGFAAGLEVVRPTAIVIAGGLLVSGLITTLVVPVLYLGVGSPAPREVALGGLVPA